LFLPDFLPFFLFWLFNLLVLSVSAHWGNYLLNTAFYLLSSTGESSAVANVIFWRTFFRFMAGLFFVILYFLPLRVNVFRRLE
jgi:hypothetical protein